MLHLQSSLLSRWTLRYLYSSITFTSSLMTEIVFDLFMFILKSTIISFVLFTFDEMIVPTTQSGPPVLCTQSLVRHRCTPQLQSHLNISADDRTLTGTESLRCTELRGNLKVQSPVVLLCSWLPGQTHIQRASSEVPGIADPWLVTLRCQWWRSQRCCTSTVHRRLRAWSLLGMLRSHGLRERSERVVRRAVTGIYTLAKGAAHQQGPQLGFGGPCPMRSQWHHFYTGSKVINPAKLAGGLSHFEFFFVSKTDVRSFLVIVAHGGSTIVTKCECNVKLYNLFSFSFLLNSLYWVNHQQDWSEK